MKIGDIIEKLNLKIFAGTNIHDIPVTGAYTSDLLSDVMANSREGDLWITLQIHPNIIAVAGLKNHSAVILVNGREPEKDTLSKAEQENRPVLGTEDSAFMISGKIYALFQKEGIC
jgi:predicted transcriptional regulator